MDGEAGDLPVAVVCVLFPMPGKEMLWRGIILWFNKTDYLWGENKHFIKLKTFAK